MQYTTIQRIKEARRFFEADPDGVLMTGVWTDPRWTRADFRRWFSECLAAKINRDDTRRVWRKMQDQYQNGLRHDAIAVNDFIGRRIRHTGCQGLLHTPELRRRYPQVNTQPGGD